MPVFECSRCHVIENTALCNYWSTTMERLENPEKQFLCSKCDPEIGKWHGMFPRQDVRDYLNQYPDAEVLNQENENGRR